MLKKRKNKNKAEIASTMLRQEAVKGMRAKVKDELYPLLLEGSDSVEDAKVYCQAISIAIKQAFNNRMIDTKVKDLGLLEKLDPENDQYERYKKALEMFADEPLTPALEMLEGMTGVIDSFIREEMTKRKLDSLKATFL